MKRRSPLAAVFLTVVIDLLGFGIVLPLLPLYGKDFNAHGSTLALLFISFSVMQFITAPLWGRLSDRVGRRPVMLVGLCGSAGSYALFGLAPLTAAPLVLLFVSRILAGTFGGTISTAYAYIADVTTQKERARGMALIGAAFGIGFTIGPAIGGIGNDVLGPAAPGFIASGFSVLALMYAWRNLLEPERHERADKRTWLSMDSLREAFSITGVASILMTGFVAVACFGLLESTLSLLGKRVFDFTPFEVGLLFSYFGFWSALNQGVIVRRMLKKVREETMLIIGPVLLGAGLVGLAVVDSLGALMAIAPLPVLGFGMIMPSLSSLLSRRTPATDQGGMLGLNQSLQSLARIVGPYAGITLFETETALPFFVGAGAMAIPLFLAIGLRRTPVADAY